MIEHNDLPSAALLLWEQGFHVIPLGSPNEIPPDNHVKRCHGDMQDAMEKWPKTPRIGWRKYQTTPPTKEEVEIWWRLWPNANIGLLTGSVIVVDADSKEAVEFIESGNITRSPWRVKTARGEHFYYQRNPSLEIRNSTSPHKIDIRGYGGYVVAPPSVHHCGAVYEWQIDTLYGADSLQDLPILMADDLKAISEYNGTSKGVTLNIDVSGVKPVNRGEQVEEGRRNDAAASLAGHYFAKGLEVERVKSLVQAWNANNKKPLSREEIDTVVESIARTAMAKMDKDERPDPDSLTAKKSSLFFHNFGELQNNPPVKPDDLWGHRILFSNSRILIAGAPKIGKTYFNMELAVKLAINGEMLGWQTGKPCKIAYLNAEVLDYFVKERIEEITNKLNDKQKQMVQANLFITGRIEIDLLSTAAFYALFDEIERIKPDVIIVDPLANVHSANEDKSTEVLRVLNRLSTLADINKSAIVLAHHVRKGQVNGTNIDPFDAIRGSGALRGWADTNIMLYYADNMIMSAYQVRNGPSPDPRPIYFDHKNGYWREGTQSINIDMENSGNNERAKFCYELLANNPEGLSRDDLASILRKELDISARTIDRTMSAVLRDKRIASRQVGREKIYYLKSKKGKTNGN